MEASQEGPVFDLASYGGFPELGVLFGALPIVRGHMKGTLIW